MITLYTIHCARCKVLEMKLKQTDLEYSVVDDEATVVNVGKEHGIFQAPFLETDNGFLKFEDAVHFVNSMRK